jgi:hypothetical protein
MNNRIEELLKQSTYDVLGVKQVDQKQFAELIVRECMSVADLPKNPSGQWDYLESSEVIAKHFGVDE